MRTIIILLIILLIPGCTSSDLYVSNLNTNKDIIEEINLIDKTLKRYHPDLFDNISEEEWDLKIKKMKEESGYLDKKEINMKIKDIISDIEDAHTMYSANPSKDDKVYPIGIRWFDNELRVMMTSEEYKDILGMKVLGINNNDLSEVICKMSEIMFYDNEEYKKSSLSRELIYYDSLKYVGLADMDNIVYNLEDNNGNKINKEIKPETYSNIKDIQYMYYKDIVKNRQKPVSEQQNNNSINSYWYKFIETDNILYIDYSYCIDDNFEQFLVGLIDTINTNKDKIENIVFDLRGNPGGDSSYMCKLISKVEEIDGINDLSIYTFINGEIFSSGILAILDLATSLNSITIGSPTREETFSYGNYKVIELPYLESRLSYSTQSYDYNKLYPVGKAKGLYKKCKDNKEYVYPEIYIRESFDNYKKGIDDCYEYVKNN